MKKYELTTNTKMCFGRKLYQIKALKDFGDVKAGELGGYIEKEENLSHIGDAWIFDNAWAYGKAWVHDDAQVHDNAWIFDDAWVFGDTRIFDDVWVCGNARVFDDARVFGDVIICNDAQVCDEAQISSDADYICFKGFGSKNRNTTMFRIKTGDVYVCCGCFTGSLKEFSEKVKETHGTSKYAKEYLACVEVAKIHFEIGEKDDK